MVFEMDLHYAYLSHCCYLNRHVKLWTGFMLVHLAQTVAKVMVGDGCQ